MFNVRCWMFGSVSSLPPPPPPPLQTMKHLFLPLLMTAALTCALPPASAALTAADDAGVERAPHARWRGINTHIRSLNEPFHDVLDYAANQGANAIRINFELDSLDPAYLKELQAAGLKAKAPTPQNPLAPYERNLSILDSILPICRQLDVQVILAAADLHGSSNDAFYKASQRERDAHLINFWRAISKRYKDDPIIVAYDIKTEPNYADTKLAKKTKWNSLLSESIKAIRSNDTKVWLIVAASPNGSTPQGFAQMPVIKDPRVIYTFQHYTPYAYTHQSRQAIQKPDLDKAAIERTMEAVVLFQQRNPGARILVGEFGVIRWAPDSAQWLADSIEIFERRGWDWTFQTIGESPDWDPTYTADDEGKKRPSFKKGIQETDRLKVLKNGWALNAAQN
ncbi:hypothetical protein Ga0100230_006240 [Opitutaceae bacterium TAV3]|nr:hypothetical protein Ga0100230_006240 [Opitutaceae bacterium TAV3]